MKKLIIVGGGLHGTHLLLSLIQKMNVTPKDVMLIDPHPQPLACWTHRTRNIGMNALRSTRGHHVGLRSDALLRFAESEDGFSPEEDLAGKPYDQPSLRLFQAHTEQLCRRYDVEAFWHQARVSDLKQTGTMWSVHTEQHTWSASSVVLALGSSTPAYPTWAQEHSLARISHVYAMSFRREAQATSHRLVVGGGIGAIQTALACLEHDERVTLLSRHPMKEAWFDADPGWVGPRYMRSFWSEPSYARRRKMIREARLPGTLPPPLHVRLLETLHSHSNRFSMQVGDVKDLHSDVDSMEIVLMDGTRLEPTQIVLATGWQKMPMPHWLEVLAVQHGWPRAECGSPIVQDSLEWCSGLYVMGPLAELELGPTAGNIIGARRGAVRITEALHSTTFAASGIHLQPSSFRRA